MSKDLRIILLIDCRPYRSFFQMRGIENYKYEDIKHVARALTDGFGFNVPSISFEDSYSIISDDIIKTISSALTFPERTITENAEVTLRINRYWVEVTIIPQVTK